MKIPQDTVDQAALLAMRQSTSGEVLFESETGILLHVKNSDVYLSYGETKQDQESIITLLQDVSNPVVYTHQVEILDALGYDLNHRTRDYTIRYFTEPEVPLVEGIEVRPLTLAYAEKVHAIYKTVDDLSYIQTIISQGMMFGAFDQETLVGFIGFHLERSMGLLEILPNYRRRGIARLLEAVAISSKLQAGKVCYCNVESHNEASLKLQASLGGVRSKELIYWSD